MRIIKKEKSSNGKWYNSNFFEYLGQGLGFAAICLGIGYGFKGCTESSQTAEIERMKIEVERIKAGLQEQIADLNGNGIPDKFYVIDGKIAISELDGKKVVKPSLEESLEEVLEE